MVLHRQVKKRLKTAHRGRREGREMAMCKKYRLWLEDGFIFDYEAADMIAAFRIAFRVERSRQKRLKDVQEVG